MLSFSYIENVVRRARTHLNFIPEKVLRTWKIKAEIKINKANKNKIPEWNGRGMAPQGPVRTVRYCFSACARYIVLSVLYLISFLKSHWKQCCLLLFCGWWLSVCVYFHVMLNFSAFYANKYAQFNQNKVVEHEKLNVFKRNGFFSAISNAQNVPKTRYGIDCLTLCLRKRTARVRVRYCNKRKIYHRSHIQFTWHTFCRIWFVLFFFFSGAISQWKIHRVKNRKK